MAKAKRFYIPQDVRSIVRYVCADYDRRRLLIAAGNAPTDIIEEAIRLNTAVDEAIEGVDAGLRGMRGDIACERGYDHSALSAICAKNTYYAYKRRIVYAIARNLLLL